MNDAVLHENIMVMTVVYPKFFCIRLVGQHIEEYSGSMWVLSFVFLDANQGLHNSSELGRMDSALAQLVSLVAAFVVKYSKIIKTT